MNAPLTSDQQNTLARAERQAQVVQALLQVLPQHALLYTTEDADFLRANGVLDDDRIAAVETGCCPHTAIRDDVTANL